MNITKKLYCYLVEDFLKKTHGCGEELEGWYPNYKKTRASVDTMRDFLVSGYEITPNRDRQFLNDIIREHHNPISAGGHYSSSKVTLEKFERLINSSDFLKSFSNMIKVPNLDNFEAFAESWRSNGGGIFFYQRINRIFAACTYNVSSTTSVGKFVEVFKIFREHSLIKPYPLTPTTKNCMREKQWYQENIYLMTELRRIFKTELINGKVDLTKLSIFVWEVCSNSKEIPNLIKRFSA